MKTRRAPSVAIVALALGGVLAGCTPMTPAVPKPVTHRVAYQLAADYYSQEAGLGSVIDPQVFEDAPRSPPGIGPEAIAHAKDVRPVSATSAAGTSLLSAHATELDITLGQWQRAAGSVSLTCVDAGERATSSLTGLIPNGQYSLFVLHADVTGAGRYTPWGDAKGTNNNFSATAEGTAKTTETRAGCLGKSGAAVIVWHSDGEPAGAVPGLPGVTSHDSLVAPLP